MSDKDPLILSILEAIKEYEKVNKTILSDTEKDVVIAQYLKKMGISLIDPNDFSDMYYTNNPKDSTTEYISYGMDDTEYIDFSEEVEIDLEEDILEDIKKSGNNE